MKTVLVILSIFGLSGCAGWETFQAGAAVQGARAADEALQVANWGVCEAVTMGAWQRRYGQDQEKARAWATLCGRQVFAPPADSVVQP